MNLKSVNALANAGLVLPAGSGGGKAGKNCTIQSIEPITGGNRVTFAWTKDEGGVTTTTMDVMDGADCPFSGVGEGLSISNEGVLQVETATEQEIDDIITGIDDILEVTA